MHESQASLDHFTGTEFHLSLLFSSENVLASGTYQVKFLGKLEDFMNQSQLSLDQFTRTDFRQLYFK